MFNRTWSTRLPSFTLRSEISAGRKDFLAVEPQAVSLLPLSPRRTLALAESLSRPRTIQNPGRFKRFSLRHLSAEFIACAVKTTSGSAALPAHVVKAAGRFGYLMVHDAESDSVEFEQGLFVGQQEERARIIKLFHDEVSSTMMAALFALESAKNALEAQNLPAIQALEKASELLSEAVEKTADVLEGKKDEPHKHR